MLRAKVRAFMAAEVEPDYHSWVEAARHVCALQKKKNGEKGFQSICAGKDVCTCVYAHVYAHAYTHRRACGDV